MHTGLALGDQFAKGGEAAIAAEIDRDAAVYRYGGYAIIPAEQQQVWGDSAGGQADRSAGKVGAIEKAGSFSLQASRFPDS